MPKAHCVFRELKKSPPRRLTVTAENLCPSATVVRVHNEALAEEYAESSTTLVVVESDDHMCGPVDINKYKTGGPGVCWWHPQHIACSLSDSRMMRVQNCAGRGIKRAWQLLKVLLELTRDLFALFVQQKAKTSTDIALCADLSAIAELLVQLIFIKMLSQTLWMHYVLQLLGAWPHAPPDRGPASRPPLCHSSLARTPASATNSKPLHWEFLVTPLAIFMTMYK